jgi:hypothetical protein
MIILISIGITILFLLAIFLAGIMLTWLIEQFLGLDE